MHSLPPQNLCHGPHKAEVDPVDSMYQGKDVGYLEAGLNSAAACSCHNSLVIKEKMSSNCQDQLRYPVLWLTSCNKEQSSAHLGFCHF